MDFEREWRLLQEDLEFEERHEQISKDARRRISEMFREYFWVIERQQEEIEEIRRKAEASDAHQKTTIASRNKLIRQLLNKISSNN